MALRTFARHRLGMIGLAVIVDAGHLLLTWLGPAWLVRGETLSLRTREFIEAVQMMAAAGHAS